MLRVRDIMTRTVMSLDEDAPIESAAKKLADGAITGAPVRDRHGNIIGVLSRTDLADPARQGEDYKQVSDAMTDGVWAVHPDEPAIEAVRLMVDARVHRVIVMRGPGKLEGLVSAMDVLRALADGGDFGDDQGLARQREPRKADESKEQVA